MLFDMLPKYVCDPVVTTTAVAEPLSILVPKNAILHNSIGVTFSLCFYVFKFLYRH